MIIQSNEIIKTLFNNKGMMRLTGSHCIMSFKMSPIVRFDCSIDFPSLKIYSIDYLHIFII
jgi:hypothetical protein